MQAKIHTLEYFEAFAKTACAHANNVMQKHGENVNLQNRAIDIANLAVRRLEAARGRVYP